MKRKTYTTPASKATPLQPSPLLAGSGAVNTEGTKVQMNSTTIANDADASQAASRGDSDWW